ncbi:FAD-dependent monooxygenase [Microbispora sp. NPDC088329]|uniref:FAD-dependent monooxygenase n=1 Tax=Microbispora sp. NPDC088329 TaxID=3154869 RepID=UPI00343E697A
MAPYGVTPALVERGLRAPRFTIRDRDTILVPVPFGGLPTRYPYTLMISQADTEAFLLARLREEGGGVERPAVVARVEQDDEGAAVTLADGRRVRARYVVGADGLNSTVREQAGIAFSGGTYAESFALADVRLSGAVHRDEVVLYFSPAGMVVVAPLPGGLHRIVAAMGDAGEAPRHPDAAFVQDLLDARGPERRPAVVHEVIWGSRFRVHHRIVERFRSGRVLLAGDAAHVHSPAGGQGMNLGVEDGVVLGETLARVLAGAPDDLLDDYAASRRPAAEGVVALAGRLTGLATASAGLRRVRNLALGLAGRLRPVQRRLAWRLSGLDRR